MLSLVSSPRRLTVRTGNRIPYPDYNPHITGGSGFGTSFLMALLPMTFAINDGVDYDELVGNLPTSHSDPTSFRNRGLPPGPKLYSYSEDVRKYGSTLAVGFDFISDFVTAPPKGEKQVFHSKVNGSVTPRVQDLYTYESGEHTHIHGIRLNLADQMIANYYFPIWGGTYYTGERVLAPYGVRHYTYPLAEDWKTVFKRLKGIEHSLDNTGSLQFLSRFLSQGSYYHAFDQYPRVYGFDYGSSFDAVRNVKVNGSSLSFESFNGSLTRMRWMKIKITLQQVKVDAPVPPFLTLTGNRLNKTIMVFHTETHYLVPDPSAVNLFYGWKVDPNSPLVYIDDFKIESGYPSQDENFLFSLPFESPPVAPDILLDSRSKTLGAFEGMIKNNLGLLRPSCMYSFADAMSKYQALASNYIEVIYEAEQLFSLFPDSKLFIKSMIALYNGDIRSAGFSLAKLFAGTHLQLNFGILTTVANGKELLERADRVSSALQSIESGGTFHGKFVFDMSEFLGLKDVTLTTRTKVRLAGASNDFLIKLLQLDAIGLAPYKASNLWDLIPMSWLLDYFVGMSTRLDVVDSIVLGHMMGVSNCVHSFTTNIPIPESILRNNGLSAGFGDAPEMVFYAREVSNLVPTIFDSEVDFGSPRYPPDKGIIAALLAVLTT